jgi:hypothetical protein
MIKKKKLKKDKDGKDVIPYPTLNKEEEVRIFKSLAHMSYKDAAKNNGILLIDPTADDARLTAITQSIVRKIRKAPELWGLTKETIEVVQEAMDSRSVRKNPKIRSEIAIMEESFRDKLDTMRDTVAELISKKLDKYNTAKGIDNVQLRDLKDLLSMAIDKGRLLRGESTDNIIKLSRIDTDNMSPDEALKVIMRAREAITDGKK